MTFQKESTTGNQPATRRNKMLPAHKKYSLTWGGEHTIQYTEDAL